MDAATACAALAEAGLRLHPDAVRIETRGDRVAVHLPGDRLAWFPATTEARQRLAAEGAVLRALAARCSFRVPRVLHTGKTGWQVRDMVPGASDPQALHRRTRTDRALARRIGHALGSILAEQHGRVRPGDVAGWLPPRPPWPGRPGRIRDKLARVVADAGLLRGAAGVLRRYGNQLESCEGDRVLVHGDLGFHNVALAPGTDEVAGVFDYDDAAWADRHQDFRYLVFPGGGPDWVLDAALAAYQAALGLSLDRDRIRLCNAACALGFLADREGVPPEAKPCGRTLAEDLEWVGQALRGVGSA